MLKLFTLKEAAEMLAASEKTLREHVNAGDIAYVNVGRGEKRQSLRFALSDIEEFIERRKERKTGQIQLSPTVRTNIHTTIVPFTEIEPPRRRKRTSP